MSTQDLDYRQIVEARYDRGRWLSLLHDIFGSRASLRTVAEPVAADKAMAEEASFLGRIALDDGYQIAVYEVRLTSRVLVERNRAGIRNLLLTHWRSGGYAGALMFGYREGDAVLRFSYVSETWQFDSEGRYTKSSTDTRRYTYLLGEGHRSRTAIEQFQKLRGSSLTLQDLTKAFSVEALSDRFFDQYKHCYEDIVEYATGKRMVKDGGKWIERTTGQPDEAIMQAFAHFDNPEKALRDYVKKLMGRLVFIQFLQKKGWMGAPAGNSWDGGDRDFLQHLYERSELKDTFVDDVLEPLFDDINTRRDGDLVSSPRVGSHIKVPYLNGGLFERDDCDRADFPLPARFIGQVLDFFAEYNFTIDENDPDDAEVGVDPEMLGRVFENLLEDNKDKGAFYTPKEIVQYMCRESLTAYLQTGVTDESTRHALRRFVATHDAAQLGGTTTALAEQVATKLRDVKICDPAIGSGAFPMGLLRELFACRQAIEGNSPETAVEIKAHIIQQNIYGVDIERGAVDIARLRFWLALIVDEATPAALPNLDFKIMQGNSLLEQYQGVDLSTATLRKGSANVTFFESMVDIKRKALRDLLQRYFSCADHRQKASMREQIQQAVLDVMRESSYNVDFTGIDISASTDFFLWHTWFADVFNRPPHRNGFDIVIGNPPYGAKLSAAEKAALRKVFTTTQTIKGVQKGSLDTFTMFIEQGFNMLCKNGSFAMIVPIALTSSDSLSGIHRILLNKCDEVRVSSYAVRPQPVFKNAVVDVSILLFTKTERECKSFKSTRLHRKSKGFSLDTLVNNLQFTEVKDFITFGRIPKIGTDIERSILAKLKQHKSINDYIANDGDKVYYRFAGGRYFKVVTNYSCHSSAERAIEIRHGYANVIGALLSSSLSFWYYQIYSDNHNWKDSEVKALAVPQLTKSDITEIEELYAEYLADIERNAKTRKSSGTSSYNVDTFKEYKIVKSKAIIDRIDDLICPLYGLTKEETEFIKNYELEFRMSGDD